MATTTYVEFSAAARAIGARTDSAGAAVGDVTAEEDRLIQSIITEGYVTIDAFLVQPDSGMTLAVGSGSAKADLYAVEGEAAGQGVYLARLDQTPVAVTVPAAEASQVRNDEIYLVVADAAYDGGARSLPRIGYRKGDPGGAAPGPDTSWKASALLATVNVPAAAGTITAGNITDERAQAGTTLASAIPSGSLTMYAGTSAPEGWLLCDGSAVSRAAYADLFGALGTAYGVGDGSTTFNLPNFADRFPVGAGSSYSEGDTGGADSVTLTAAQMPSHTHNDGTLAAATNGDHSHQTADVVGDSGAFNQIASGSNLGHQTASTGIAGTHSHDVTGNTGSAGSGSSHENRPPYLAVNFIIKT